ncbi:transposase, MuDR, MULE transposase domain protein [Tanacetum coccineum]
MEGVINASGQWKYLFYNGQQFTTPKEAKDIVYLHSIESRRNLKLYKNDSVRIRARCEGKVPVFTMSQGTGPTGPNSRMEAGPSGSSGPTTRSKKRKNTGTNDDSQASPSFLDAHDKGISALGSCMWEKTNSHKIGWVNPDIPVKAVQDQLQRELEVQISMSKAFRAKAKAEREIRGDHVLQYSMLRDYVVELQSTNPNTTVKIAVERNTDPSLPTRVFQRIYCFGHDDIDLHPTSHFTFISGISKSRAKSDLTLLEAPFCEVFNGKIVLKEKGLQHAHWNTHSFIVKRPQGVLHEELYGKRAGKEEPLHVIHAETLDTIRKHVKDKVAPRAQKAVVRNLTATVKVVQDDPDGTGVVALIKCSSHVQCTRRDTTQITN